MSDYVPDTGLEAFDEVYEQAEIKEDDFGAVPDGKYQAVIERVTPTKTKESGRPMITWQLRILGPTCKGRMLWKNSVVTADSVRYVKRDLLLCGVKLQRFSDLLLHCGQLTGLALDIRKKTNGDYENIYFDKRLSLDPSITDTAGEVDGRLPF